MPPRALKSFEDEIRLIIEQFQDDNEALFLARINALFSHFPKPYPETLKLAIESKRSKVVALILDDDRFPLSAAQIISLLIQIKQQNAQAVMRVILGHARVQALHQEIMQEPLAEVDVPQHGSSPFELLPPAENSSVHYKEFEKTPARFNLHISIPFYAALYSDEQTLLQFWLEKYEKNNIKAPIIKNAFFSTYNTLLVSCLLNKYYYCDSYNSAYYQRYSTSILDALKYTEAFSKEQACLSLLNNQYFIQQMHQSIQFSMDPKTIYLYQTEKNKSAYVKDEGKSVNNEKVVALDSTTLYLTDVNTCVKKINGKAMERKNYDLLLALTKMLLTLPVQPNNNAWIVNTPAAIALMLENKAFADDVFKELFTLLNQYSTIYARFLFGNAYQQKRFKLLAWMMQNTPNLLEKNEGYCFEVYYKATSAHAPVPAFDVLSYAVNQNQWGILKQLWDNDDFHIQFQDSVEHQITLIPWPAIFTFGQNLFSEKQYSLYFNLYKTLLSFNISNNASLIEQVSRAILNMLRAPNTCSEAQIKELFTLFNQHCVHNNDTSFLELLCLQQKFSLATWMMDNTPKLLKQNYALYWTMHHHNTEMAVRLLTHYPSDEAFIPHMIDEATGNTLLHIAVLKQQYALIPLLRQQGVSLTMTNLEGKTAAQLGAAEALQYLQAPVTQQQQPSETPSSTTTPGWKSTVFTGSYSFGNSSTALKPKDASDDGIELKTTSTTAEDPIDIFLTALKKCPQDYRAGPFGSFNTGKSNNQTNLDCVQFIESTISTFANQRKELKEMGIVVLLLKIIDYRISSYLEEKHDKSFYRNHLKDFLQEQITKDIITILNHHKADFIKQINGSLKTIPPTACADPKKAQSLKDSMDFLFEKLTVININDLDKDATALYQSLPSKQKLVLT